MDDEALRTHHVIAALAIGLGFAGFSIVTSPFRRLSHKFSVGFAGDRGGLHLARRSLHRMDEPLT